MRPAALRASAAPRNCPAGLRIMTPYAGSAACRSAFRIRAWGFSPAPHVPRTFALSARPRAALPPPSGTPSEKHSIFRAPRALSARLFRRGIPRSPVFPPCPAMASGCALPGICASFEKGLYAAPFPCPKTAPQPANRSAATPAAQRRFDNMPYLPVSG